MLAGNLAGIGGSERMIAAEEYLNPGPGHSVRAGDRALSQNTLNTPVETPLQTTPTQKFFPPNYQDAMTAAAWARGDGHAVQHRQHRHSSYGGSHTAVNDAAAAAAAAAFNTFSTRSLRPYSNFMSTSCDPLKLGESEEPRYLNATDDAC